MPNPDPAQTELGYTIVYVPNVAEALAFYERAFGIARGFLHASGMYGELATGATKLAFADERQCPLAGQFAPNRPDGPAPAIEVAFVVSDVARAYERALAAGAAGAAPPEDKPWGQTVAYVRDLNGVFVELCTAVRG